MLMFRLKFKNIEYVGAILIARSPKKLLKYELYSVFQITNYTFGLNINLTIAFHLIKLEY